MNGSPTVNRRQFLEDVTRGRQFEVEEKRGWRKLDDGVARFKAPTSYEGRKGRIDILIEELGDFVSIVEVKATDWDRMKSHRIRPNALRHARQIWRYIEREVDDGRDACPGIIYPNAPVDADRRIQVEGILNERAIQVVWPSDGEEP